MLGLASKDIFQHTLCVVHTSYAHHNFFTFTNMLCITSTLADWLMTTQWPTTRVILTSYFTSRNSCWYHFTKRIIVCNQLYDKPTITTCNSYSHRARLVKKITFVTHVSSSPSLSSCVIPINCRGHTQFSIELNIRESAFPMIGPMTPKIKSSINTIGYIASDHDTLLKLLQTYETIIVALCDLIYGQPTHSRHVTSKFFTTCSPTCLKEAKDSLDQSEGKITIHWQICIWTYMHLFAQSLNIFVWFM